jgi:SAM-dependent methyltransferase
MIIAAEILMLLFAMGILWIYVYMLIGEFKGAPFVPTSSKNETEIWDRVKLVRGKLLIDVGSGDGRMLVEAVKRYGVRGVGIEIQPILVGISKLITIINGIKVINFICKDFWKEDLSRADYLYFYLGPKTVEELAKKLEREQKKEQIVISKAFEIKSWKDKVIDRWDSKNGRVWVYKLKQM